MDHVFAVAPHARGWLIAHPVSKLARVRAALGGMIKPVQEGEDIEGREVLTAHARILAPLSPRERDSLPDLLIRVIQAQCDLRTARCRPTEAGFATIAGQQG